MDLKGMFDRIQYRASCWHWIGSMHTDGYGLAWDHTNHKQVLAHRYMYELLVGPPPDTLHHECENRACVNVGEHVFASTRGQNVKDGWRNRQQRCQRGHDRWHTRPNGRRYCMQCAIDNNRKKKHRGT